MSTYIDTLKDKDGNNVAPRTLTQAVTDNNGNNLDTLLGAK